MSALAVASIVFACIAAAALLGMTLRTMLSEHHLDSESKDMVKTGMGLVATMAALVLGLLVASAKSSFDAQKDGLDQIAANLTLLDNILEQYGPPTRQVRETLRRTVAEAVGRLWPADASQAATLGAPEGAAAGKSIYAEILDLSPQNDAQRTLQSQALQLGASTLQARLLLVAKQASSNVSVVFLVVLTSWLVVLFASFGLFAPRNVLVIAALMIAALSVSGAIFLTLELSQPFGGIIQISSAPIRNALAHLGP